MKNYTQVYVKNSFEAAETYCKAFGAEITREFKNVRGKHVHEKVGFRSEHRMVDDEELFKIVLE